MFWEAGYNGKAKTLTRELLKSFLSQKEEGDSNSLFKVTLEEKNSYLAAFFVIILC